jgi:hypothetical protein
MVQPVLFPRLIICAEVNLAAAIVLPNMTKSS